MSALPVQSCDDAELVRRAQGGDRLAFEELVRRHQNEVFTLALRIGGQRDMAADVAQEAFIRAWRALPRFRGEAAFSTWMYRITVNTAHTLRARSQKVQTAELDEVAGWADPTAPDPGTSAELVSIRRSIEAALEALPADQRAVVVLKDVYDWPHADIAAELDISVTAAKVRLHRARKRLRLLLEGV